MKRRGAIALVLFLCLVSPAFAANWYVRPSGGSGSGMSWTNAWNDFNSINWSSVSCGDTIWVAGGTYKNELVPQKSCSSGSQLYIRRARSDASACTSATGWSSGYDSTITQNKTSTVIGSYNYITISGRTTAEGGTQGWVMDFTGQTYGIGVHFPYPSNGSNITIEYIEIKGPGQWTNWTSDGRAIDDRPLSDSAYHTFSHMKIHGWETPLYFLGPNHVVFEHSEVYNTSGTDAIHANIAYIKHSEYGIFRYNKFYNNVANGTGIAFSDGGPFSYWKIYGNVFYDNDKNSSYAIAVQRGTINGLEIYNNVFDNSPTRFSDASCGSGSSAKNNVLIGNSNLFSCGTMSNNITVSANAFKNRSGRDYHPVSTIGSGYMRNSGTALTSDGYTDKDPNGNTRGVDGRWDAGAFEYEESNNIDAPTGIKILKQQ